MPNSIFFNCYSEMLNTFFLTARAAGVIRCSLVIFQERTSFQIDDGSDLQLPKCHPPPIDQIAELTWHQWYYVKNTRDPKKTKNKLKTFVLQGTLSINYSLVQTCFSHLLYLSHLTSSLPLTFGLSGSSPWSSLLSKTLPLSTSPDEVEWKTQCVYSLSKENYFPLSFCLSFSLFSLLLFSVF